MGRVKVDVHKTEIKHDTIHSYTEEGIGRLLDDIQKLEQEETYGGDINATTIRIDLEIALNSKVLTPRQRIVAGLYYFVGLNQEECADVLGITQQAIVSRMQNICYQLSSHMCGCYTNVSQNVWDRDYIHISKALDSWCVGALYNHKTWWLIPNTVRDEIITIYGQPKSISYESENNDIEYPYLTGKQFNWIRYIETPRPEIYRVYDNYGSYTDGFGSKQNIIPKDIYGG